MSVDSRAESRIVLEKMAILGLSQRPQEEWQKLLCMAGGEPRELTCLYRSILFPMNILN
jgi:hypothetical protein